MRILIAEPYPMLRAGIASLIGTGPPDWEVVQVSGLTEARHFLVFSDFTICLIGSQLLQSPDLWDLRNLRFDFPALKVIVCSRDPDRAALFAFFRAGAHGCVTECISAPDLLRAIGRAASSEVSVPKGLTEPAMPANPSYPRRVNRGPIEQLTGRQSEVLSLLGKGCSTKEIALCLGLSVGTIKVHLAAVYRTLGVRNRLAATIRLVEHGHGASVDNTVPPRFLAWDSHGA